MNPMKTFGLAIISLPAVFLFLISFVGVVLADDQTNKDYETCINYDQIICASSTSSCVTSRKLRILCYGDSLKAGESYTPTSTDRDFHPYATFLQAALQAKGMEVDVDHIGLCGWTTDNMLHVLDDPENGLRFAINNGKDRGTTTAKEEEEVLLVVVLLAGTNDLWPQNLNPMPETVPSITEHVVKNLLQLHQVALRSSYHDLVQSVYSDWHSFLHLSGTRGSSRHGSKKKRQPTTPQISTTTRQQAGLFALPLPYERDGENWSPDGIHFSKKRYQVLGQTIADTILEISSFQSSTTNTHACASDS